MPLSTNDILNRVLVVHNRSLPMYLHDALPWVRYGDDRAMETLRQIVRDQKQVVDRIGAMILENNGVFEQGEYPLPFTGYHDVAFDWVLDLMIERQQKTITYLQKCAEQLSLAPMAKAVVEETVGMAKGHLELLQELKHPVNGTPAHGPVKIGPADTHHEHAH
jgi:hypothetical protein